MEKPNFFIVGGAKCGTTTLANWLKQHPNVYMAPIKEPDYFYPNGKVKSLKKYQELFLNVTEEHIAIGEASVRYLYSIDALKSVFDYTDHKAKFIVLVRNPVEMAESLHSQRLKTGNENIKNFKKAWYEQKKRSKPDYKWPKGWYTPEINLYGDFCKIGTQCLNLINLVGKKKVLILFLEDIKKEPYNVWIQVQKFLTLPEFWGIEFNAYNKREIMRSYWLNKVLKKCISIKKTIFPNKNYGILRKIDRLNKKSYTSNSVVYGVFEKELKSYFSDEIKILENITGRDLKHWR